MKCPRCSKLLKKGMWNYECDCGFKLQHTIAKVPLEESVIQELITNGTTKEKITGFVSKNGNPFDSYLKLEGDRILFDFGDNRPVEQTT